MQQDAIYLGTAFLGGILSFFSPCIIPILPMYFGIFAGDNATTVTGKGKRRLRILLKSTLFVAGISCCFVVLGFGASALGSVVRSSWFVGIMGAIVILLGIHQTGLINFKFLQYEKRLAFSSGKNGTGYGGAFLLGLTFSFGWTPCIGPVLGAVLTMAATSTQPFYGAILMAGYSLGFLIPFLIIALCSQWALSHLKGMHKHLPTIKIISGILIIIMGIVLMTGQVNSIISWFL